MSNPAQMGNDGRSKQLMSNDGDEGFGKSGHDITEIVITVLYSPCLIIVCPAARSLALKALRQFPRNYRSPDTADV